jgi:hypothetical protein
MRPPHLTIGWLMAVVRPRRYQAAMEATVLWHSLLQGLYGDSFQNAPSGNEPSRSRSDHWAAIAQSPLESILGCAARRNVALQQSAQSDGQFREAMGSL